jgi:phosphoadenosine phosphosulfate reductase
MGDSIGLVLSLFRDAFGTDSPLKGRMMFFNKVPGEDRTDEIIADGSVLGILRFDMKLDRILLEIRQPGADMFYKVATKNVVIFGGMSGHLKGKTVPGANIVDVIGDFDAGSTLILKKGQKVGPGIALADSDSLRDAERAVKIRDLNAPAERPPAKKSGIREFVGVNEDHLRRISRRAAKEIRRFLDEKNARNLPITVSFSGGKDSLAAYGLTVEAKENPELMYIDTGLEFPETVDYVRSFALEHDRKLHVAEGKNGFLG